MTRKKRNTVFVGAGRECLGQEPLRKRGPQEHQCHQRHNGERQRSATFKAVTRVCLRPARGASLVLNFVDPSHRLPATYEPRVMPSNMPRC